MNGPKKSNSFFYFLSLLFCTSCFSSARADRTSPPSFPTIFEGRWSPDCTNMNGINIDSPATAKFTINENQIDIYVTMKLHEINDADIFYVRPADLGRGGMNLDWNHFSTSRPIASMKITDKINAKIKWIGFYDKKNSIYQWREGPDFYESKDAINFHKCNN